MTKANHLKIAKMNTNAAAREVRQELARHLKRTVYLLSLTPDTDRSKELLVFGVARNGVVTMRLDEKYLKKTGSKSAKGDSK